MYGAGDCGGVEGKNGGTEDIRERRHVSVEIEEIITTSNNSKAGTNNSHDLFHDAECTTL